MSVAQQAFRLKQMYPGGRKPHVGANLLIWNVNLQPTPLSVTYTVHIEYLLGRRPKVTVVDPVLETRPGEPLPHVYPGNELCLYYGREFVGTEDFIAHTIVPWASEWLYFYETWLTTGRWHADEVLHNTDTIKA